VACEKAGQAAPDRFADVSKTIGLAKGAQREVGDIAPENLPAAEDAKKLERSLKSEEKKLPKQAPRLGGKKK
jgi:hypothetical protein